MVCPGCGIDVGESQKFCHECGVALDPTTTIDADLPTGPVPLTEPPTLDTATSVATGPEEPESVETGSALAPPLPDPTPPAIDEPTEPVPTEAPPLEPAAFDPPAFADTTETETLPAPSPIPTAEMPAMVFDGSADLDDYPTPREPFRLRVEFILALFAAIALLMTVVADITDIRTTRPAAGIATGTTMLDDLGTSLGPAAFAGVGVMVVGALLACFGLRWGAGLAGGGGLALVGWAGLTIGLAELPIAVAESITRTSTEEFTLRVTRDIGWWLIVGVGVIALLVFLISLRSIGSGRRPALNPIVGAVSAVAMVVLSFGPLVPVGAATFADNFSSPDPDRDLPTLFFTGRLGQVALIALAGVIGLLIVRSYGLGLAVGGVSVAIVLWALSLAEVGDRPVGIADRNPGAATTVPHAVTTVGMIATLVMLTLTTAFAIVRLRSRPTT
jgi:hypothetical protein